MLKEGFNVAMSHLQKFSSLQELSSLVSDLAVSCQGPASPVGGETLARPYTVIFMISQAHKWHIKTLFSKTLSFIEFTEKMNKST